MLFNSIEFLVFFPVVTILYFSLPYRYRWIHLLFASCIFYMAFIPSYILILFFLIIIDYYAGIYIEKSQGIQKKRYLIYSILANVGILAVFKYYNFFIDNINQVWLVFQPQNTFNTWNLILPLGLSFHTFQAMSYTIEVYRGHQKAEKHLGIYALYVMFYPQLVAGPIERPQNLIPQFYEKYDFDYNRVVSGLRLMMWGFFKKIVIADRIATLINPIFDAPYESTSLQLLMASFFFSFQVFCDFSGYSDIALGSARVMGFRLIQNFNFPYHAQSIAEYRRRWHISLVSWFKDYVYIALGGNRGSTFRRYFNLMTVFVLSGFWHGARWTFIIWGGLHGLYVITEQLLRKKHFFTLFNGVPTRTKKIFNIITTFLLVALTSVFFRISTVTDACYILKKIATCTFIEVKNALHSIAFTDDFLQIVIATALIVMLECVHYFHSKYNIVLFFNGLPKYLRWTSYYVAILIIMLLGSFDNRNFIYFQF
jgi:alginate O-acetyltransferase complex protein AlgI